MSNLDARHSYFSIELISIISFEEKEESEKDDLLEMIDFVFIGMNVKEEWYSFLSSDGTRYLYFFKSESRKRLGQLRRLCEKNLPSGEKFAIAGLDKSMFYAKVIQLKRNSEWIPIKQIAHFEEFSKDELKLEKFENQEYWYAWQKDIYYKIFDENSNIIESDSRKIISIIDDEGKKGKSSFLKWICYSHPKECIKLGFGSSSQLRASVLNNGPKRCYFIDLPRTAAKEDKLSNLISVVEEIKNGHVMSTMYGKGGSLIMPHPHIFIFSNKALKYDSLSKDRWEIYKVTDDFKLKQINVKGSSGMLLKK
ncbi:MAG: Bovine faeces associated smacovirus 5 [Cyanobacteriota bacterium]|jgi:hypothetical protein